MPDADLTTELREWVGRLVSRVADWVGTRVLSRGTIAIRTHHTHKNLPVHMIIIMLAIRQCVVWF